jgi:hypothetical protein
MSAVMKQQPDSGPAQTPVSTDRIAGYRRFGIGGFEFARDEYFVTVTWPAQGRRLSHKMEADKFLKALMRDVAWGFFYGWVNFDRMFGTRNRYGEVEVFAGRYDPDYHGAGLSYVETFESAALIEQFKQILRDWTNAGFDPFAAAGETQPTVFGPKNGDNVAAIERYRIPTSRMPGIPGDSPLRSDANGYPVNRAFADVPQDAPAVVAAPGFEGQLHAFNLFAYLSRSDVTWNPSVTGVCKDSLACPTTEEQMLPVIHGNDRVEWFIQLSDEIYWDVTDKESGRPRAKVIMRAGDVAAMPADIRHQGFSPKRSMLYVWENATPGLPQRYERGELKPYPIEF